MKERPILFSAPMVRALLAGTKTQTRRVMKDQPPHQPEVWQGSLNRAMTKPVMAAAWDADDGSHQCLCPYGVPGDRLWVREAFTKVDGQTHPWIATDYRATYTHGDRLGDHLGVKRRWTPSIHMPREASRILLEIISVRVERLQEISEADAKVEGIDRQFDDGPWRDYLNDGYWFPGSTGTPRLQSSPVLSYRSLWESINGPGSWDANPWVWVIEFKRVAP